MAVKAGLKGVVVSRKRGKAPGPGATTGSAESKSKVEKKDNEESKDILKPGQDAEEREGEGGDRKRRRVE